MLFGNKDGKDADVFWKEREEELGCPVLGKILGRVVREEATPLWGLVYTTEKAIYFQTFRSDNWLTLIFSGGKGSGRTKDETIEIPRESVRTFGLQERKGGLFRLFRQPPLVELAWTSPETGEEKELVFEMEGDAKAFVATFNGV